MSQLPELITLLALALFFGCGAAVGRARGRYKIAAPATTGHPDFERVFRVQMNTLEALVIFLPALWIASRYADARLVGGIGALWLVARAWFAIAYARDAKKRGAAFVVGMLSSTALWLIAIWGVLAAIYKG